MTTPETRFEKIFESRQPRKDFSWLLVGFSGLLWGSAYQISRQLLALGAIFSLRAQRWWLVLALYGLGFVTLSLTAFLWTRFGAQLFSQWARLPGWMSRRRWLGWLGIFVVAALYPTLVLALFGDLLADIFPRLLLYALLVLFGSLSLRVAAPHLSVYATRFILGLSIPFVYQIATIGLGVSSYPFSLSWSETSRYYYASLFFAERIYGLNLPPTVLHPTRYFMQSVPFLIESIPLWGHRLWQAFIWVSFPFAAAWLFARRFFSDRPLITLMIAIWGYLFMFQGPVYYHLAVPLMIVFAGFDAWKPWRTLVFVVLASVWAGVSRLNWFPVPAMLAAVMYLFEEGLFGRTVRQYLWPPFVWGVVGTLTAFASQAAYVLISGNDAEKFASSFASDLLWYRLWPNETYPLGLFWSMVLVSLPAFFMMMTKLWIKHEFWHPIRIFGIQMLTLVLLLGGLVVSVKIGGGSNLHNLDAYLVLVMVTGAYFYFQKFFDDVPSPGRDKYAWNRLVFLVAVPVVLTLKSGGPFELPKPTVVNASLDAVHRIVDYAASDGGEVLFISQRHLLYFDDQLNLPLVPKYENVFFMEMVMSRNSNYLNGFYDDLQNQRFAAIVSDQVVTKLKDPAEEAWVEEHNLWAQLVSRPLLCYYEPRLTLRQVHVQILYPARNVDDCTALNEARQLLP